MKKKLLAATSVALTMIMLLGMTAFAAPSPTTSPTTETNKTATEYANISASDAVTVDGVAKTLKVTLQAVSRDVLTAAQAKALELVGSSASVLQIVDVSLPAGTTFGKVQLTFNVPGVVAGQKVYLLHLKADGVWEKITPDSVENGKVTATFTSLSPVAVVAGSASAQTGETLPVLPMVLVFALVSFAGVVITTKKFAAHE